MYNKDLKTYIKRLAVLLLPMIIVGIIYVINDPFKTIHHYERYFDDNVPHVGLNMDYVSTENFVHHNPTQRYNAFIFGNSRSQYWQTDYWKRYIGKDSRCYHYYGSGESLYSLEKNIRFIHDCGNSIDYALLVLDIDLLSQTKAKTGHLFITPPRTVAYQNVIRFHATNFAAFLNPIFIYTYIDLLIYNTLKPYMLEKYMVEQPVVYHAVSNEIEDRMFDQAIDDKTYYTTERMLCFQGKQYPDSISPQVLFSENIRMLTAIAKILSQHHTQYKIVISPLYNQIKLNSIDLQTLGDIFGHSSIYDFSGKSDITSDYHNYYEESHYRPVIARRLMDSIYNDAFHHQPRSEKSK